MKSIFIFGMFLILIASLYCLSQKNLAGNLICLTAMVGLILFIRKKA